jgi:hypothetical protein
VWYVRERLGEEYELLAVSAGEELARCGEDVWDIILPKSGVGDGVEGGEGLTLRNLSPSTSHGPWSETRALR